MTKRYLANLILTLLGINTRTSSATPEEIEDTIKHMQSWMYSNNGIGRRIGWVDNGTNVDPDDEAGIPDWAEMGVVNSMAIYLAPYFEKPSKIEWVKFAAEGMQTIAARTLEIQSVQYPAGFPRGQAQCSPYGPKYYYPENRVVTGNDYLDDEDNDPVVTP